MLLLESVIDRDERIVLLPSHFVLVDAMTPEVDFLNGGVITEEAFKRLLSGVCPHVTLQVHRGLEVAEADLTHGRSGGAAAAGKTLLQ